MTDPVREVVAAIARGEPLGQAAGVPAACLEALYSAGYGALQAGCLQQARGLLSIVVALQPEQARGWAALGSAFERMAAPDEALAHYALAAALADSAPLWLRCAECAVRAGRPASARRAASNALAAQGSTALVRQRARLILEEVDRG